MKRKTFCIFLVCEAVFCLFLYLTRVSLPETFTVLLAFPFEQIGIVLRKLSLSGGIGNALSIIMYVAISFVPLFVLFIFKKRRRLYLEDSLLVVLSAVLFPVIYLMINPGMLGTNLFGVNEQIVSKALLGGVAYSVLLGYIILRILRIFFSADTNSLQKYIAALLCVLNVLFVYLAFGAYFGSLLDSFEALRVGNTGSEHSLGMSYVFLVIQYIVNALPNVLNVLVVFAVLKLLNEFASDRYSEATVVAANILSRLCGLALTITVILGIGFNLLQLVFLKGLRVVNGTVQIPLLSIAFVLAALLLAQFIRENKQLKDDNDLFI
ncbi:hypothetical protein [Lachnoclostridium phytofermentans]|uniref:DUF2975 domain-containing protein n=1 Tax=Lachnoclostridium phytofermentans (strain ATCC 700394 / DSM 18823 / ISDg) TaxID=357809 RepID=A9KT16_LACP7|nr:hypothetical protein [Lachnoclostridium phytofermentans]ABX42227.1 conserved hypothetical protein [Lachnoclostridium phytofermentans ISDg]